MKSYHGDIARHRNANGFCWLLFGWVGEGPRSQSLLVKQDVDSFQCQGQTVGSEPRVLLLCAPGQGLAIILGELSQVVAQISECVKPVG